MAVVLTSGTRQNPPPCQHFSVVCTIDGSRTETLLVDVSSLSDPITDDEMTAVLRVWAKRQIQRGKTLAQLIGQTIFTDVP